MPGDSPDATGASQLEHELANTEFARITAYPDGDSVAAAGILAKTCSALEVPFRLRAGTPTSNPDTEADTTVIVVGHHRPDPETHDLHVGGRGPASKDAFEATRDVDGVESDPVLALAGLTTLPTPVDETAGDVRSLAEDLGYLSQRPGVATATKDLMNGLANALTIHTPFSGRPDRAQANLAELDLPVEMDVDGHRRLEAFAATATAPTGRPSAREALQTGIRPYAVEDGRFQTLAGYGDVLRAIARDAPGIGFGLVLDDVDESEALEVLGEHAEAAHQCVRRAEVFEYDSFAVARVDGESLTDDRVEAALPTVARLVRDFRTPMSTCYAVTDGYAAGATRTAEAVGPRVQAAGQSLDGGGLARQHRGEAQFDGTAEEFVQTLRDEAQTTTADPTP